MRDDSEVTMLDPETAAEFKAVEARVTIPGYLLPDELRELHEKIRVCRAELRVLERKFNSELRERLRRL